MTDLSYESFVAQKLHTSETRGLDVDDINPALHPHIQDVARWALRRGRAALFLDTGLGKSSAQAELARHVVAQTGGRFIIFCPLAVTDQMVREGERFGVSMRYLREDDGTTPIVVTNYDLLHKFNLSRFAGVSLDESSILKAYDGATRNVIIGACQDIPYRFAASATPAPNDHTELGNHAEFLGIKSRVEMLAEFFCHDGGDTSVWRLKGHAEESFWRWCTSWAAIVGKPSDLGHNDSAFVLPPLRMHEHVIPVEHSDAWKEGLLFAPQAKTLTEQRKTRRFTMGKRVAEAARIVRAEPGEKWAIWCELNDEQDALEEELGDACVSIFGSLSADEKVAREKRWREGEVPILLTKMSVFGYGMNWQHCAKTLFVGASHSFEMVYQAERRFWRFGQTRPVDVHFIRAETEDAIVANFKRKEADFERMRAASRQFVLDAVRASVCGSRREWNDYDPRHVMTVPSWVGREAA